MFRFTIGNNNDYKIPIAEVKGHTLLNISKELDTNEEINRNLRNSNAIQLDFERSGGDMGYYSTYMVRVTVRGSCGAHIAAERLARRREAGEFPIVGKRCPRGEFLGSRACANAAFLTLWCARLHR